ncbi:MAG: glycosyltransferase [Pedosphaera sp.]|nr:glycosyltransferase [Pedosphaera sp.]
MINSQDHLNSSTRTARVTVSGLFFRLGPDKFHPKGITYGPLAADATGVGFGLHDQAAKDLATIRDLGANLLRVYEIPPRWFLDLAHATGLKVMVDAPWNKYLCFLDGLTTRDNAREIVRRTAEALAGHPAAFAISVVNEIPPEIVRWSGVDAVAAFLDELVAVAKAVDPALLCTFGNFPPTEFLQPRSIDFVCFNVYLHHPVPFEKYLTRLQIQADSKPLILGECGVDSIREGVDTQAAILSWTVEIAFRKGLAGLILYSFTDEWWKDGERVTDWAFGLTTADRKPKPAFAAVADHFRAVPYLPLPRTPRVSVVVASYNGASTLEACLRSLSSLRYPNYDVILVDDGSTDGTAAIASRFPAIRQICHEQNRGLSAARNSGINAATGEIIAFTDSDCRADEDWLHYLIGDLLRQGGVGIGGHNFLPPDDSPIAAAVMASPGGPAHVLLDDEQAEHIPGCNMAFYKTSLDEIGGFNPVFRAAGDDVDVCWRLQERGGLLGFSPSGFVWHNRRNSIRAYLRQQKGYGRAEALLEPLHPAKFNALGNSRWQGHIYSSAMTGIQMEPSVIYHGLFGSAFFQTLYRPTPGLLLQALTSLEFLGCVILPLLALGFVAPILALLGCLALLINLVLCSIAGKQATLSPGKMRWWSRPLIAALFFLQPLVRGWARFRQRWTTGKATARAIRQRKLAAREELKGKPNERLYWADKGVDRGRFLDQLLQRLREEGWAHQCDDGWKNHDIEISGGNWTHLTLITAAEYYPNGKVLLRCRLSHRLSRAARTLRFGHMAGILLCVITLQWGPAIVLLVTALLQQFWYHILGLELEESVAHFVDSHAAKTGLIPLAAESINS